VALDCFFGKGNSIDIRWAHLVEVNFSDGLLFFLDVVVVGV